MSATDPISAVCGALLHTDAWDTLDLAELARRSLLTDARAHATVSHLEAEGVVIACTLDGQARYRLTTSGVRFASELCAELPLTWRR